MDIFMKFTSFVLPLVLDKCPSAQLYIRNRSFEGWLAYNLDFLGEIAWELRKETENECIFFSRFDNVVFVVAIKFQFCIFEATRIDFRGIFEDKLEIDC
jgi:hypothetical protein